jgi:hypothetical protein
MEHTVAKHLDLKLECKPFTSNQVSLASLMRVIAKCKQVQEVETRWVTSIDTSQVTLTVTQCRNFPDAVVTGP